MSPTSLRIAVIAPIDVDRALCDIGEVVLERCPDGLFVDVAEDLVSRTRSTLARAGVVVEPSQRGRPAVSTVPGSVGDLAPLTASGITDRIWVRPVDLADATLFARRGLLRRYDVTRLRPLLREEDRAYIWRRIVWMPRSLLRARELRKVRPIVFDRSALTSGHERLGYTRAASLARWLAA